MRYDTTDTLLMAEEKEECSVYAMAVALRKQVAHSEALAQSLKLKKRVVLRKEAEAEQLEALGVISCKASGDALVK